MKTINAQQLKEMLRDPNHAPVVNVLSEESFREKHIPGSSNIPVDAADFISRFEAHVRNRSDPVVVYCARRECDASERAAERLEEAGFTNVMDFEEGVQGWESAGYELERSAVRTA